MGILFTLRLIYKTKMFNLEWIMTGFFFKIAWIFFRFRKTFTILLEEEQAIYPDGPNYLTVQAPSSKIPERHLCAVCGFPAPYTCIPCGSRYCSTKCLSTHEDTRCLKWTAWKFCFRIVRLSKQSAKIMVYTVIGFDEVLDKYLIVNLKWIFY